MMAFSEMTVDSPAWRERGVRKGGGLVWGVENLGERGEEERKRGGGGVKARI